MTKGNLDEPVTRGVLNESVDAILKGMDNLFEKLRNEFKSEIRSEIEPLKKDVNSMKADITFIKRDIQDIKADFSTTPYRREFKQLKEKMDNHIQFHH